MLTIRSCVGVKVKLIVELCCTTEVLNTMPPDITPGVITELSMY